MVTDAAQNSSVVYDGTITTANRTTVSSLLSSPIIAASGIEPVFAIVLGKRTRKLGKSIRRSYGDSALTMSGQLRDSAGVLAPGVPMALVARDGDPPIGSSVVVAHTTTNAAGEWSLHAPKGPSRQLRVIYGHLAAAANAGATVAINERVSPVLGLHVGTPGGARLVFSGRLAISPLGRPRPLVTIETKAGDEWEAVGRAIRVGRNGAYRYAFHSSPLTLGRRFAFRAQTPATSLWHAARSTIREAVVH